MANKNVFGSKSSKKKAKKSPPKDAMKKVAANAINHAGGLAYNKTSEEQLAQLACVGCLNNTYYVSAVEQLGTVVKLAMESSAEFLAKTAIYSRRRSFMKDMPALLMAVLSKKDPRLFRRTYPQVINNPKMLRNFVQIIRSGVAGRVSLGRAAKEEICKQLNNFNDVQLLNATVGNDPSMADVIRLAHPKGKDQMRQAAFKFILGYPVNEDGGKTHVCYGDLPINFREFIDWKKDPSKNPPATVDFQLVTGTPGVTNKTWRILAKNGNWHFTRMNLNTFKRHDVFSGAHSETMIEQICAKLKDEEQIKKARVFPYQLYTSLQHTEGIPGAITNALQDALDVTVNNIPLLKGKTAVFIDGSGSMTSPVTGHRKGATTEMSCQEVACLIGAGLLKKNPDNTDLFIFDTEIKFRSNKDKLLNARDSLFTIVNKVREKVRSGGTAVSVCYEEICKNPKYDNIIVISDNESWADRASMYRASMYGYQITQTASNKKFQDYLKKKPDAKAILIDLSPNTTTQVNTSSAVLNVGGFSNAIFDVMSQFFDNNKNWVNVIKEATYIGSDDAESVAEAE